MHDKDSAFLNERIEQLEEENKKLQEETLELK